MRYRRSLSPLIFATLAVWVSLPARGDDAKDAGRRAAGPCGEHAEGLALFKEQVRPVLVAKCLDCHGGKATKGDFDLSDRKPLIESGTIEGGGEASPLYALITHAEEPHMPRRLPSSPTTPSTRSRAGSTSARRTISRWSTRASPCASKTAPTTRGSPFLGVPTAPRRRRAGRERRIMGEDAGRSVHPRGARRQSASRRTRRPIVAP